MRQATIALVAALLLCGCEDSTEKPGDFAMGEITATSKKFDFPKALKQQIDREYVKFMKSLGPPYDIQSDEELLAQVPREFLDLEVTLWGKSEQTVSVPRRFVLPRGGGGIDLKEYIRTRKGSFYVDFNAAPTTEPDKPADVLHVYYLSTAKKREVDGQIFGAGCGNYIDISNFIHRRRGRGVQVNATDERYVSVLSGTYYFVAFAPERIYLAAMSIEDSRYPDLTCSLGAS